MSEMLRHVPKYGDRWGDERGDEGIMREMEGDGMK